MGKIKRHLILLGMGLAPLLCISHATGETFRTHSANIIRLEDSFDKKSCTSGINDCVIVKLPEDTTFLQGIEINVKVPKEVAEWRDSVAWSLYSSVTPEPDEKQIDFSGIRSETGTFDSLSLNLLVPLEKANTIKKDAYSHLTDFIASREDGFIFLRMQLVMKGVSDSILNAQFQVQAKPILIDKGTITVKTTIPENSSGEIEPYTLFMDGKQVKIDGKGILVETGSHNISLVSDFYRNEVRTITVEQAKNTEIEIQLRDIKPVICLVAPENTKVFFDDEEYKAPVDPFYTTQGDHRVKFVVGDYEIVRTITVSNGRSYNVAINIEAQVNEMED